MPGTLWVVATPIGNLEDMTFRAVRVLREADLIAAEDTRHTLKLLNHFGIQRPLVSVREHNEAREAVRLVERLRNGASIALVSDAGTPAIADPGSRLVRAAREAGIRVVPVPGASAVTAALSASGLDAPEFVFLGFPPSGGQARAQWLERLAHESRTAVFFEAPHRFERLRSELGAPVFVKRHIFVHREITKINEESVISPNSEIPALETRGEFVVILSANSQEKREELPLPHQIARIVECLAAALELDSSAAEAKTASLFGVAEATIRKIVKKHKYSVKRQNALPS